MNILEKEIEDLLFDALTDCPNTLIERGLYHKKEFVHVRQPNLGNYGRPDVIGYSIRPKYRGHRLITVSVFELKKDQVNCDTLLQAGRYATGINQYFKSLNLKQTTVSINFFLIGKTVETQSDFVFLLNHIENVSVFTYSLDFFNGLKFKLNGGYFMNTGGFPGLNQKYSDVRQIVLEAYYSQCEVEQVGIPVDFRNLMLK